MKITREYNVPYFVLPVPNIENYCSLPKPVTIVSMRQEKNTRFILIPLELSNARLITP